MSALGSPLHAASLSPCVNPAAVVPIPPARFDNRAQLYRQHAQVQRDMAAWLANWLPAASAGDHVSSALHDNASAAAGAKAGTASAQCSTVGNAVRAAGNVACVAGNAIDLGAGDGTFTQFLLPHFSRVTALDAAAQMLAQGHKACPQANWLHGDAWTLSPLGDSVREADWILSSSLLQWCRSPHEVLRHWAQCCRSGTRMLHGFYIEPTLQEWRSVFGSDSEGGIRWLAQGEWLDAFADSGWRVMRSECKVRPYVFPNALSLARSLHGTGVTPAHGRLGAGQYRSLLREYDQRFACAKTTQGNADAADHVASDAVCPATHGNATQSAVDAAAGAAGVIATWALFRIEVELP